MPRPTKGQINPALAAAAKATQWKKGQSGRPPGTKIKLATAFIDALCTDFDEHGVEALRKVRETDPSTYIRAIASILPKEIEIKRPLSDLSEDELLRAIELIRLALGNGPVIDGTGVEAETGGEQTSGLPAIRETTGIPPRWQ